MQATGLMFVCVCVCVCERIFKSYKFQPDVPRLNSLYPFL